MLDTVSETSRRVNGDLARETLRTLGRQLDDDILLSVSDGGIVLPGDPKSFYFSGEKDLSHERQGKSPGPTAGSGERTEGRKRPADQTSSIVGSSLREFYEKDIDKVKSAYPGARFSLHANGMWMTTESRLLEDQFRSAVFLTFVPFERSAVCRSWAFWNGNTWVGPRHTNFPDGSVCAFDPRDNTWLLGESLVYLLDLYTIWALRHLHLLILGRWPGRQSAWHAYERILEFKDDELCGCDKVPSQRYKDCCKDQDNQRNRVADAINFTLHFHAGRRSPPAAICKYFNGSASLPNIDQMLFGTLA